MKYLLSIASSALFCLFLSSCLVVSDGGYPGYPQPQPQPYPGGSHSQPHYGSGGGGYTGSYYRQQGALAGRADARRGLPYNPQPSLVRTPSQHRNEYNKGYKEGYGGRDDSASMQDTYRNGLTMGAQDARMRLSAKPSRHNHLYKKSTEDAFKRGYYAGYR